MNMRLDFAGIARAGMLYLQNYGSNAARRRLDHHPAGRQELPVDQRVSFQRKSRRRCWPLKIERTYSKERSSSFISTRSISVWGPMGAAASLLYFDKSVHRALDRGCRLSGGAAEGADLLHPFRQRDRALERRNYVKSGDHRQPLTPA